MLRNYGFEVYDLWKGCKRRRNSEKAKETNAPIIGLSALMTTTMLEMREVVSLVRQEGLTLK